MNSGGVLQRIREFGPRNAEELRLVYASETEGKMRANYFDESPSMAELVREKGSSRMLSTGHVGGRDRFYEKSEKADKQELQDQIHRLWQQNSVLGNRLAVLAAAQERAREQPLQGLHALEARVQQMEQRANAEAYLKPPRPANPPFNPEWHPSAPNFIIYGGGRVEDLRNGGEQDPMVGSPPQERVPVARLG